MNVATRVLTGLLALIGVVSGVAGILGGVDGEVASAVDNQFRYFAGVWLAVGLGLAYCAIKIRESTELFRVMMLAVFLGGVARAIGVMEYGADRRLMMAIGIELVVPAVLVWMQGRLRRGAAART